MKTWMLALSMTVVFWVASSQDAQATNVADTVSARNAYRAQIKSHHILDRPYRAGHFYGNTVRRRHHHGTALPMPRNSRR
jgi:hypothetical protein